MARRNFTSNTAGRPEGQGWQDQLPCCASLCHHPSLLSLGEKRWKCRLQHLAVSQVSLGMSGRALLAGHKKKGFGNARQSIPVLSFRCTSCGVSCMSWFKERSCVLLISLSGNTISLSGHPLCFSCSMVSQRMVSGSPALVKFCV